MLNDRDSVQVYATDTVLWNDNQPQLSVNDIWSARGDKVYLYNVMGEWINVTKRGLNLQILSSEHFQMAVRFVKFMSYEFANEITRCKYDTVYLFADETV